VIEATRQKKHTLGTIIAIGTLIVITGAILLTGLLAKAEPMQQRSFYDSRGSFAGSSTQHGNTISIYDRSGRFNGSAIKNSDGTTSFYDRSGRFTGSSTNTSQRK
jgi:hypothetical protein